jgi:nicotinamidase/pyrazinamidase
LAKDLNLDKSFGLVVVDVQNDFADPGGSLYVDGGETIIPLVNRLVESAERAGAVVVYTQDWHPPVTPHFQTEGGVWPVHCVRETWGAELHPGLKLAGAIVRKGTGGEDGYSGFTVREVETGEDRATDLDSMLRDKGVRHVVVVGLAQDVCVKATALDARRLGYDCTVVLDATRPVNLHPGDDEAANSAMAAVGISLV